MILQKSRWSRHYESSEEELLARIESSRISTERWAATEYEVFVDKLILKDTTLWCVEGSMTFKVINREIVLQAGDRLDIPAHTSYQAIAGLSGAVCYKTVTND